MDTSTDLPPAGLHGNRSPSAYPRYATIHELFESHAAQIPHEPALACGDRTWTYAQLNWHANHVARELRRAGVERGQLVGLCVERSCAMIAGILGILKAGAAYVPLDPEYPDARLEFMARDTELGVIVADLAAGRRLQSLASRPRFVTVHDDDPATLAGEPNPKVSASATDLAYVMYTSGSTGVPKGVMVDHRAVIRLVRDTHYCRFGRDEVFLQFAPISFDASTFEIWGPLLNGGTLAIMPPGLSSLDDLGEAIRKHRVTTLWLTSGLFNLMVERNPRDLAPIRQLLAGGDVLSPSHVRRALQALDHGVVINGYGPTESTTFACTHTMTPGDPVEGRIPIGRPIANTTAYLLDDFMQPVEPGTPGELFLGGDGVAQGYWNRPELTAEKFLPDRFSLDPQGRLYRTGDLARQRPDGVIEFLGRVDGQVKISGHRIEPGEIESALNDHPDVKTSAVVAVATPDGSKTLIAFVVERRPETLSQQHLRTFLGERLPPYMVPSTFVTIGDMPLTSNGKVDREALLARSSTSPAPQVVTTSAIAGEATGLEACIAAIWSRVLHRPVATDGNFFDLGGTSLQLIEAHASLQTELRREIPIVDLFQYTTVHALAQHLGGAADRSPDIETTQARANLQREAFARFKPTRRKVL